MPGIAVVRIQLNHSSNGASATPLEVQASGFTALDLATLGGGDE